MRWLASLLKKDLRIQGFVFNWKGHEANARNLEKLIGRFIGVTVINSDDTIKGKYRGWIDLDDEAYFAAQWNAAVLSFKGDILFHIQADAEFDDFRTLITKASSMFRKHGVGVYEPNVDFTDIRYNRVRLTSIEPGVSIVPFTDCTCWFIDGTIIRQFQQVDLSVNRFGWGIPRVIGALVHRAGKKCVRDYEFTIKHPKGRGYSSIDAANQKTAYVQSLDSTLSSTISMLERLRSDLQ